MRKIINVVILLSLMTAMMGSNLKCPAEQSDADPSICSELTKGNGANLKDAKKHEVPQPAEHDPVPHENKPYKQKPSDKTYLFRLQYAMCPEMHSVHHYAFGPTEIGPIEWDQAGWSTKRVVSPGTQLMIDVDLPNPAVLTCAIVYVKEDKVDVRVRAHHVRTDSKGCHLTYVVTTNEENKRSL